MKSEFTRNSQENVSRRKLPVFFELLHFSGFRYWSASLLPALVGTTLPLWLHPPSFSFKWITALEFLVATVLFHAGFCFLQARFEKSSTTRWSGNRLLLLSAACIILACLLGLLINRNLSLNEHVYKNIFIAFGISVVIVGLLYVAPPVRFARRLGGEVVLAEGLGMLPVLGAYLVQVGDLTRTVYLASLPLVVATGIWIWVDQLITIRQDEESGRRTLVIDFGARFSARWGVLGLELLLFATLLLAVYSASISPVALAALLLLGVAYRIVTVSWSYHHSLEKMIPVRRGAIYLHFAIGGILVASSLLSRFF